MFDSLDCPGLGKTVTENARTNTQLHGEFSSFVGHSCSASSYTIRRGNPGVHVGPLQDDKRIAITINPRQQLCEFFVALLEFSPQPINLIALALDGVLTAVEGFLHLHGRNIALCMRAVMHKHVALVSKPLTLMHSALAVGQTGSTWETAS